jgi:hypothetical protein
MDNERNKRMEELLGSLDGAKRAEAPDFFYTRLRARLEKELTKNVKRDWILKPVYIVTTLLLVISINVFVFLRGRDETPTNAIADNNESVQQSIASEYSLNDNNTVYDLNPEK